MSILDVPLYTVATIDSSSFEPELIFLASTISTLMPSTKKKQGHSPRHLSHCSSHAFMDPLGNRPKDHINIRISHSGSKARNKGDTRNHRLLDSCVYVVFCGPSPPPLADSLSAFLQRPASAPFLVAAVEPQFRKRFVGIDINMDEHVDIYQNIDMDTELDAVDSKKLEYGPGTICAGFPSSLGFGLGGQSCSDFLACTVSAISEETLVPMYEGHTTCPQPGD